MKKLLVSATVAMLLSMPTQVMTQVRAKATEPRTKMASQEFVFGVNLPWFDGSYGHDLGHEPSHPKTGVWYDGPKVSGFFSDINRIGFQVVRFWLFERAEGLKVDSDGFIVGMDETFLRNLDDLVRRAQQENVKLYLCLNTGWDELSYPSPITNERQQRALIEHAIKPIAKRFKGSPTIAAFDIINEIESEVRDKAKHKATVEQAKAFIRNNAKAIKSEDPKRLVSAGSGYHGWKMVQDGVYRNLGLDFYDIHVYRDDGYLPHVSELNVDKPVIVGEFGQATRNEDDALQQKVVTNFMRNALAKGYAGCFVWAYGPKERYFHLINLDGKPRPVVADIQKIIKGNANLSEQQSSTDSIKKKLAGTKWINTNGVPFEWTQDGRFRHNGNEVPWKALDAQRVEVVLNAGHIDVLVFNKSFTEFKQLIKGGPNSHQGKRGK